MIKTIYPYTDYTGKVREDLIKTYTDNPTKILLQLETGRMYKEAVDKYPCRYTYEEIDDPEITEDSDE